MAPSTLPTIHAANRAAVFHPADAHDEDTDTDHTSPRPAIEVAGCLVYVGVDSFRNLRISVHYDGAEEPLLGEYAADDACVPTVVHVGGPGPVWTSDSAGVERYPDLNRQAHRVRRAISALAERHHGWEDLPPRMGAVIEAAAALAAAIDGGPGATS